MTLRSEFSYLGFARHLAGGVSAVQAHGVAILVDQFDAVDAVRAARGTADLVHEFEQHPGVHLRSCAEAWLNPEMQHGEAFMRRAHENGNAQRSSQVGYREQRLHSRNVAHTDPQAAVMLIDFRHSIGLYRLLDPDAHAMLVDVEEQQLLQRG